jgi:hypothetical protein
MEKMVVRQVSIPAELLKFTKKRTKELGIGFPEYIRHLVIRDAEKN